MEKSLITAQVIKLIYLSLVCSLLTVIAPVAMATECPTGDLNGDCKVNFLDFEIMVDNWLEIEPNLPFGSVIINEVLAHSHLTSGDWIELYNTTGTTVDISGWYLSDSVSPLTKYKIANGTTISPHGYIVFYEIPDFGVDHGTNTPFQLSENGESVYLSFGKPYPNTTWYQICDDRKFDASETSVSFGRYTTSLGDVKFVAMEPNTPGQANSSPKVGPVTISELMYDPCYPPDPNNNSNAEYIELKNIKNYPVTLQVYDASEGLNIPWKMTEGPDYTFPLGTTIPAHGFILLVRNKPVFQALYPSVPPSTVYQWSAGKLSNDGENVVISMPGDLDPCDPSKRYYIRVDNVNYSDGSQHENFVGLDPWPTSPDHEGKSLSRIDPNLFGNDVANWHATTANPGQ